MIKKRVKKKKEKKKKLSDFFGTWAGDDKEIKKIYDKILKERHKCKIREIKL